MKGSYSKNEIDLMFKGVSTHILDTHRTIEEKLDRILEQTTQHNGRMSKIEMDAVMQAKMITELEKQDIIIKSEIGKYVAVASAVIGVIVTVINLVGKFLLQ